MRTAGQKGELEADCFRGGYRAEDVLLSVPVYVRFYAISTMRLSCTLLYLCVLYHYRFWCVLYHHSLSMYPRVLSYNLGRYGRCRPTPVTARCRVKVVVLKSVTIRACAMKKNHDM